MPTIDLSRLTAGVTLPKEVSQEIWGLTERTSAVMAASRKIVLPGSGVSIPVMTGNAVANWTNETDEIGVSRPTFATKEMSAYKLGVIVPMSKEFVRDAGALYDAVVQMLPSALALKFDQTVAGGTAPGSNFDTLSAAAEFVIDGTDTADDIKAVILAAGNANAQISHWVAAPALHGLVLTTNDSTGRPLYAPSMDTQSVGSLYGAPILRVAEKLGTIGSTTVANLNGIAGDFANAAVYGTVEGINISVSDQTTLQDGVTSLNLWQRDMVAVKATIEVGFRVETLTKFMQLVDKVSA